MEKKVKKAVFPVAGLGTRFLPATKAMPKELLPIVDKPLIHYAVEEAVNAGIETLIFVTGRHKRGIEDYFDKNEELERILRVTGKNEKADQLANILPSSVQCMFVRQPVQAGLGHAVLCAERAVGDEPFAVLLADDFIYSEGLGETSRLISQFSETGKSQLGVFPINGPTISNYGVVSRNATNPKKVDALIEKPKYENAPSNLASVGRYILTPDIFAAIRSLTPESGQEIQPREAINKRAQEQTVEMLEIIGTRFDC